MSKSRSSSPSTIMHALHFDEKLHKKSAKGAFVQFVLLPDEPRIPSLHPGVAECHDQAHPENKMSPDHQEYIHMGEATINALLKHHGGAVLPRLLFSATPNGDPSHDEHTLAHYLKLLQSAKNKAVTFHIAAHGSPHSIGPTDVSHRATAEQCAENIDSLFEVNHCYDSKDVNDFKNRKFNFVFHTCNSGYADITSDMDEAKQCNIVKQESFIGKFATQMKALGYKNVTVSGFRGYYSNLGSLPIVSRKLIRKGDSNADSINADLAKVSVYLHPTNEKKSEIKLPHAPQYRYFKVDSLPSPAHKVLSCEVGCKDNVDLSDVKNIKTAKL